MIKIVMDHCVLNTVEPGKESRVEKPGQATITSNCISFDEFVIKCHSVDDGARVAVAWLIGVAAKAVEGLVDDEDEDEDDED